MNDYPHQHFLKKLVITTPKGEELEKKNIHLCNNCVKIKCGRSCQRDCKETEMWRCCIKCDFYLCDKCMQIELSKINSMTLLKNFEDKKNIIIDEMSKFFSIGIAGPSGFGKSSLTNLICGYDDYETNSAHVVASGDGTIHIEEFTPKDTKINWLKIYDFIGLGANSHLTEHSIKAIKERTTDVIVIVIGGRRIYDIGKDFIQQCNDEFKKSVFYVHTHFDVFVQEEYKRQVIKTEQIELHNINEEDINELIIKKKRKKLKKPYLIFLVNSYFA